MGMQAKEAAKLDAQKDKEYRGGKGFSLFCFFFRDVHPSKVLWPTDRGKEKG